MNNRLLGLGEQNLDDDLPYTLMTYSNGPGFTNNFEVNNMGTNVTRMNLSTTNFINDREYRYSANGLRDSATVHISNVFFILFWILFQKFLGHLKYDKKIRHF